MGKAIASAWNGDWPSPDCSRNATHSSEAHQVCGCRKGETSYMVVIGMMNVEEWKVAVVLFLGIEKARKVVECHVAHFCSLREPYPTQHGGYTGEAMK